MTAKADLDALDAQYDMAHDDVAAIRMQRVRDELDKLTKIVEARRELVRRRKWLVDMKRIDGDHPPGPDTALAARKLATAEMVLRELGEEF